MYKIYVLKDPKTNEIRYVGVTTSSLNVRLSQHIYDSKHKGGTHKRNWISSLLKHKLKPIIELLEECDEYNWEKREKFFISELSNLTNTHEGGKGIIINRQDDSIQRSAKSKYKPIIQLTKEGEYIKEWDAAIIAAKALNILNSSIGNVLKHRSATAGSYRWVYKKDYDNGNYYLKAIDSPNAIPIIEVGTKNEWPTMTHLYKELGVNNKTLKKYIVDNKPYKGKLYKIKI